MPMVAAYQEYLKERNIPYDIIRSSRYDKPSNSCSNIHEFEWIQGVDVSRVRKIIPFFRFKIFAQKIIKREKYDFIIVWNENTALLFSNLLLRQYKGRYCVNVRDKSSNKIYQKCLDRIISKSCFSTMPSPAGVPNNEKYSILYNRDDNLLEYIKPRNGIDKTKRIKITL